MKSIARLALTAVIATTVAFATPVFVDRVDYTRAVANYAKNSNPENDAAFRIETAKNERIQLLVRLSVAGFLFLSTNAIWVAARRRAGQRGSSSPAPPR
jgi:hypothetical protein